MRLKNFEWNDLYENWGIVEEQGMSIARLSSIAQNGKLLTQIHNVPQPHQLIEHFRIQFNSKLLHQIVDRLKTYLILCIFEIDSETF